VAITTNSLNKISRNWKKIRPVPVSVPEHCAMKTYGGVEVTLHAFLTSEVVTRDLEGYGMKRTKREIIMRILLPQSYLSTDKLLLGKPT
jgi:hypothetical protein